MRFNLGGELIDRGSKKPQTAAKAPAAVPARAVVTTTKPDALLDVRQQAVFDRYVLDVKAITVQALSKPLANANAAHDLGEQLTRVKTAMKGLDDLRHRIVDPMNTRVKKVNALFKQVTTELETFEAGAKRLIGVWLRQEEERVQRERLEAQRLLEEAATKKGEAMAAAEAAETPEERTEALARADQAAEAEVAAEIAAPAVDAPRALRTETGTISTKETWRFEVVKPELVPERFKKLDLWAIQKAVNAGEREIPGVSVYLDKGIAVRTGA